MVVIVLLPATAAVLALVTLAWLGRHLDGEVVELRDSLRRLEATGVAADELRRAGSRAAQQARSTGEAARNRVRRPRLVALRHPR